MMSATMSLSMGAKVSMGAQTTKRTPSMAPTMKHAMVSSPIMAPTTSVSMVKKAERSLSQKVFAVADGTVLDRPLRVAVIGGGPSGACAAETLAKGGVETFLLERKMDNCKVRGVWREWCVVSEVYPIECVL